jgi:hypothetical protein
MQEKSILNYCAALYEKHIMVEFDLHYGPAYIYGYDMLSLIVY